jgi:hypothetical protein
MRFIDELGGAGEETIKTRRYLLLGTCSRTGERLAKTGSTVRLVPSLRSHSRIANLLVSVTSARLFAMRTEAK